MSCPETEQLNIEEIENENEGTITNESNFEDGKSKDSESEHGKRDRTLTEKGRAYRVSVLEKQRKHAYTTLTQYMSKIRPELTASNDLDFLEAELDKLDKLKDSLNEAHKAYDDYIDDKHASYEWFDIRDREYTEFRMKISEKLRSLERKSYGAVSVKSVRSRSSTKSNTSKISSAHSMRLQAAAKTAKLKAELEFLEQDKELRRLQLMKDLAIANAEENAMKDIIREEIGELSGRETQKVEMDPNARAFVPKFPPEPQEIKPPSPIPARFPDYVRPWEIKPESDDRTALKELIAIQTKQTELNAILVQQNKMSHLPAKEPPVFTGDVFEYPAFIAAFDSIISNNVSSNKDKLYFLAKYTKGKANDVVKGFLALNSEDAYKEARRILDQRFGNPIHVAEAYKTKMRDWPEVKDGDSAGLRDFSDFIVRCQEAVKVVGSLAELNSTQSLKEMSTKLPSYTAVKWCRHAHESHVKTGVKVSFQDFANFLKNEAELANDPIFSPDALKREKRKKADKDQKFKGKGKGPLQAASSSFATGGTLSIDDTAPRSSGRLTRQCPLCKSAHGLHECYKFKNKSPEERRDYVATTGLCFGCLKGGHLSAKCQDRLICKECEKPHPTLLHGVKPRRRINLHNSCPQPSRDAKNTGISSFECAGSSDVVTESVSANANVCNSTGHSGGLTTSMIVPVVLCHISDHERKVKAYALLDNGSDSTFIKSSILEDLGVKGTEISLKLNTMHGRAEIPVQRVDGLIVQSLDGAHTINLPKAYTRDSIPSRRNQIPTPDIAKKWAHLDRIKERMHPLERDVEVGVLIGCNCPKALKPREVILGGESDPYAVRTLLGWGIIGPVYPVEESQEQMPSTCHRVITSEVGSTKLQSKFVIDAQTKEVMNPHSVTRMFELDFSEREKEGQSYSQEDRKFLRIVEDGIRHLSDGHYEVPLPMKDESAVLPNNRTMAFNRLKPLKKRLDSNETYRRHYVEFMNKVIHNGFAERVPSLNKSDMQHKSIWYIPHHGVYHPKKPDKIRVVFDCSAQFQGESLNNHLLQGPDLTNNLTGVLCRFRREPVAVMCDIEAMFYQVRVPENQRDLLRFLWWDEGDTTKEPQEYRMTVHLFGATSSPGCSNFALKATANDNEEDLGSLTAGFLRRDFYVDDGLKSVPTVDEAVDLVKSAKEMCNRGGFNLQKFTSNSKQVIEEIPVEDRAEDIKNLDFDYGILPTERALGVLWSIDSDCFKFTIALKNRPCTRRGILSTVSSIFDPLGFVAPVLLEGKAILQELCRRNIGWDDPVPKELATRWQNWKSELSELQSFKIPRCYKPSDFGEVIKAELHHFSDASFKGYGQCSYLRLINKDGRIHCSFVIGKARVTPLKQMTVPRLELTAAVVSVRVSEQLKRELDVEITDELFWTDSKVVLGYISNETKRFHVFVANRVQEIQEKSSIKQWRYVDTKSNPADEASRGIHPKAISQSKWIRGPEFLWKRESEWKEQGENIEFVENDPEVKKAVVLASETALQSWPSLTERLKYFSNWSKAKKAVALCRRYVKKLKFKLLERQQDLVKNKKTRSFDKIEPLTVQELTEAEIVIIKFVQESLPEISSRGTLSKLNPFKDANGILRVGGRLKHSSLPDEVKHPVLLPRDTHVAEIIIRHFHEKIQHQGRGYTVNEIRASGYWIVGLSAAASKVINKCITCRRLRGALQEQRMADLPSDRMETLAPFTYSAVDYFGPFLIKERRREIKVYGVLFTCMSSRAVHLEVSDTLETDSFICALRRFIARRGPIRQLRSDQGSNFIGARRELKDALQELDHNKIRNVLQHQDCDWFDFKMNVPSASHMGGVWERQIRSVRNVLSALLQSNGLQLNGESLRTLFCEAEAIVNSRPLSVDSINDPQFLSPLTPNHLLTMKTKVVLPPPGEFQTADKFSRKRWRRVQHLANEFWCRWRKEYLLSLQQRQKWLKNRRNLCVGDVVIIKDDDNLPRNKWQLARVIETFKSTDGKVRSVKVVVADNHLNAAGKRVNPVRYLDRPVQKLVLLQETED